MTKKFKSYDGLRAQGSDQDLVVLLFTFSFNIGSLVLLKKANLQMTAHPAH